MNRGKKIFPGILVLFSSALYWSSKNVFKPSECLVFKSTWAMHEKSKKTIGNFLASNQDCQWCFYYGRVQTTPVKRPHCTALTVGPRGPTRMFSQVTSLHRPCSLCAVCCGPGAPVTCSLRPSDRP